MNRGALTEIKGAADGRLGPTRMVSKASLARVLFVFIFISSLVAQSTIQQAAVGLLAWLVVVLVATRKAELSIEYFKQPEIVLIGLYVGYSLLSLSWTANVDFDSILKQVVRSLDVIGFMLLFSALAREETQIRLDRVVVIALVLGGVVLIIEPVMLYISSDIPVGWWKMQQTITMPGIFYHHAPVGWLYGLAVVLLVKSLVDDHSRLTRNLVIFAALVLCLSIIYFTAARSAYVGVFAALALMLLQHRVNLRILLAGASLVFGAFLWIYLFLDWPLIESLIVRGDSGRSSIWTRALSEIAERPLFGHGFGAEASIQWGQDQTAMHMHSMYLNTLFYGGIVGFCLLAALVAMVLRLNWRRRSLDGWYYVVLMSLVIFVFDGDHVITYPSAEFYIFLLPIFAMAASRVCTAGSSFNNLSNRSALELRT